MKEKKISMIREKFIYDFCKKKGWNPNNLSPSQLIQIVEEKGYN